MYCLFVPAIKQDLFSVGCRSPPLQSEFQLKIQIGERIMFNNSNHYTLRTEIAEGSTHYYVSFKDGQAIGHETEVSYLVYLEFQQFIKTERNLRRWEERHNEQSELTDEALYKQAVNKPKSVEELTFDSLQNEQLRLGIQSLPEIQRRRFVLYHEFGLTYEQIAEMEGCTKRAVKFTVDIAIEKIKENLKAFGD